MILFCVGGAGSFLDFNYNEIKKYAPEHSESSDVTNRIMDLCQCLRISVVDPDLGRSRSVKCLKFPILNDSNCIKKKNKKKWDQSGKK